MAAPTERAVSFAGPAGNIEGLLTAPSDGPVERTAVVCHPHPLHQGTMNNKVVHTIARTLAAAGFAALRFNFRGVGATEGEHDGGAGEADDALAATDWLRAEVGEHPMWICGFSFGAAVALRAASQRDFHGLVMVAPPVTRLGFEGRPASGTRWLVIQGDDDDVVRADDVIAWVNGMEPGPEFVLCQGAGHFFHGRLTQLREVVTGFVGDA